MNIDLNQLKQFKHVLVTGPQRSGTTIAAHILANDLSYKYYDERDVGVRSLTSLFKVLFNEEPAVIQGPCFCNIVHLIDCPNTAVVMMKRSPKDIKESEIKINWPDEKKELINYFETNGNIAEIRYNAWEKYQKPNMLVPYFELDYESMSAHPMWIEKEQRKSFRREIK